jgi:hypothetical protein
MVASVRAMGYVADDHAFTRGPGAIAALDGASSRRRRARIQHLRSDAARDARLARAALGATGIATSPTATASPTTTASILPALRRVLLPGAKTSMVRPGTVAVKYPGTTGYQRPRVNLGQGASAVQQVTRGARAPTPMRSADSPLLPGTAPVPGDDGSGTPTYDTGGSGGGGGGGGGGDAGAPAAPAPEDGGAPDDWSDDIDALGPDDGAAPDDGTDTSAAPSPPPPTAVAVPTAKPVVPAKVAITPKTKNWLIAGAALLGAYWLLKD